MGERWKIVSNHLRQLGFTVLSFSIASSLYNQSGVGVFALALYFWERALCGVCCLHLGSKTDVSEGRDPFLCAFVTLAEELTAQNSEFITMKWF